MNPLPPHLVNAMAFDEAKKLLESSPHGLHLELYWRSDDWEWECHLVTDSDTHYEARHPNLANAILTAIDRAEAYKDEEDYKHEGV